MRWTYRSAVRCAAVMRAAVMRAAVMCGAVLGLAACESPFGPGARGPDAELTSLPRSLTVQEQEVIRSSNSFAFGLLRETLIDQPADNIFLSPLSASMALGMTMNGARGPTLDGMRTALGFGVLELAEINRSYRDLIDLLRTLDRNVDMRIANSIWALEGFPFHDSFFDVARRFFDAEVASLDFAASDAAATINRWVDRNTGGRISEIVDDPIAADVVMYLINAIYFKGDWRYRFDPGNTRTAPFRRADGRQVAVQMMNRDGPFLMHQTPAGVRVLELPYSRGAFAMTIVLPPDGQDVDALVAGLDAAQWESWIAGLREVSLPLGLPRFRLEYETVMNEPLITLGMASAFARVPGTDFTGMSPSGRSLYISMVKQKTFVDVNEEGTEAAAVTSVEMRVVSAPAPVIVDRPFLMAIRERFSGTILFLGRIGEPVTK
jgi:serine protease inhibitor